MDDYEKQRPSRKQKSLGLLCQKFLARYPSYPLSTEKTTISLDEVAVSLGMYRRINRSPAVCDSRKQVTWGEGAEASGRGWTELPPPPPDLPSVCTEFKEPTGPNGNSGTFNLKNVGGRAIAEW